MSDLVRNPKIGFLASRLPLFNRKVINVYASKCLYNDCRQNGIKKMSRHMGKPTICLGENKGADQLRSNCEADQRLCFRYSDSTVPLLSKFPVSSHLLCLYSPVCVGPVRKPHCWFSHEVAQMLLKTNPIVTKRRAD